MQKYVAGFMFDPSFESVALINKKRPIWQRGLWNGIGGKIELNEMPISAMAREFKEETGVATQVSINSDDWTQYCILRGAEFEVHFFYSQSEAIWKVKTTENAEPVQVFPTDNLPDNKIANVGWLIEMARSFWRDSAKGFVITELSA